MGGRERSRVGKEEGRGGRERGKKGGHACPETHQHAHVLSEIKPEYALCASFSGTLSLYLLPSPPISPVSYHQQTSICP